MSNAQDKVTAGWWLEHIERLIKNKPTTPTELADLALAWAAIKPMADIERLHEENGEAWEGTK